MAVVDAAGRKTHRRDAAAAPLGDGAVEVVEGEAHVQLRSGIAPDHNIAAPQLRPEAFVRRNKRRTSLAGGVNRLPLRLVPRIGERRRRADRSHEDKRHPLAPPQRDVHLAGQLLHAGSLAEKGRRGGHVVAPAVVAARRARGNDPAAVVTEDRAREVHGVGKVRGDHVAVHQAQFDVVRDRHLDLRHQRAGHVAQGPDGVLHRDLLRLEARRVDGAPQVDPLRTAPDIGRLHAAAVDFELQPERIDPLQHAAHRTVRARLVGGTQHDGTERKGVAPDGHAHLAVGHRHRVVGRRGIARPEDPPLVAGRGGPLPLFRRSDRGPVTRRSEPFPVHCHRHPFPALRHGYPLAAVRRRGPGPGLRRRHGGCKGRQPEDDSAPYHAVIRVAGGRSRPARRAPP